MGDLESAAKRAVEQLPFGGMKAIGGTQFPQEAGKPIEDQRVAIENALIALSEGVAFLAKRLDEVRDNVERLKR